MPYRAKINGIEIQHKKRVALEIIKQYIENNINTLSISQLKEQLNDKHFSGVDVILDDNDKNDFISRRGEQEFLTRYFTKNDEVLNINGENIYVSTQWGIRPDEPHRYFSGFVEFAKNSLGISIDVLNDDMPILLKVEDNNSSNKLDNKIKNIILYGAPGVGKTHNYQNLISMIENGENEKEIFDTITDNKSSLHVELNNETFQTIKDEKRVEFVTFHQSYSYEDFIEGFRPNENGNIELENGIFKNISEKASGKMNINNLISIGREIKSDRSTYLIDSVTVDLINIKKEKDNKLVPIPKKLIIELIENIKSLKINLEDIKNRNLENMDTSFDKYMYGYNSILYAICKNIIDEVEYNEQKNFYIVIDEINRGNISKIFGELITLIEEDKRDVYEVALPYSKEKFKVPSNLYIIATMNSTDKSIATIDIALRRRFTFLKMKPNENLILHVEAKKLFNDLNKFIKENLNEDYMLGHSYFMKIEDENDLEFVKEYKIKPLLEEYFYADEKNYEEVIKILDKEYNNIEKVQLTVAQIDDSIVKDD